MYCKKCGSKIRDNAKFCPKCGAVLKSSSASVDSYSVNDTTDKIASSIKKDTANGKRIIVLGIGAVAAIVVIGIIVFAINRPSTVDIKGTEIASESPSEGIDSAENTSDSKNDMDSSEELADAPQTEGTVQMWMGTDPAQAVSDEPPEDKSEAKDMLVESTEEGSYENEQDDDNELIPDFGYVKVAAPDGGVNMRTDAGTEYDIVVNMIPNDTELPVYEIKEASSGKNGEEQVMVISKDGLLYPKQTIREKTRNYEDLMHDAIDDALLIFNSSFLKLDFYEREVGNRYS